MDDQAPKVIVGWDLGGGGGQRVQWLPCELTQLVLAPARLNFVALEAAKLATFEIWGLDPRLTIAMSFARMANTSLALTGAKSNVTTAPVGIDGAIAPYALTRMGREEITVGAIDPALLFANGGKIDFSDGDGCELATATEGIRFNVPLIRNADNSFDVVVNLVVRPNQPLGCRELALALAENLVVRNLQQITWDGAP